jgi:hypothetical protein
MSDNAFNITDQQRDYSMYGLEENPFPYSPVPDEDPEVYCGQEHVADTVSETASTLLGTGKSKHLVITGGVREREVPYAEICSFAGP